MDVSDFQRPPKNTYAFNALRHKQPLDTPLGKMHVELHMDDRKPPDAKMLKLAEEFVKYVQSHADYILDIIYGAYRHWVTLKEHPGWFPYLDVPADLKREQVPSYCEVRLFVDRHLKGWATPYGTGLWLFPKWDNGETLTLRLRDGAIFTATESPARLEQGVLRFANEKPPKHKLGEPDKRVSNFRKLPRSSYAMVQNACRRQEPVESPLGKCQVELHMPADKLPPDDEMVRLSEELSQFLLGHCEEVWDIMDGAYRQWLALEEEAEEDVPRNLKRAQVREYCEVRLVVSRWEKRYDTEIWLEPKWGQEFNLILKCRDGAIVTANESPFKLEKGVLKLLDADTGEAQEAGLVGSLMGNLTKMLESFETERKKDPAQAEKDEDQAEEEPGGEEVEHPVFGKLVREEGGGLLTFRVFPFLRQFGDPDPRAADGQPSFSHLEKDEREAVENWQNSTAKLATISNRGLVCDCLRAKGVFDLSVQAPEDGLPSPAQEAAYKQFVAEEKKLCANLMDALIRYYHFLRETAPDMFDWIDEEELVEKPDAKSFAKLASFGGLEVCRASVGGSAALKFFFSPIWDEEHGLQVIMHRGHVIMLGQEAYEMLRDDPKKFLKETEDYGGWGREQMTNSEKEALQEFVSKFEPPEDEDIR